MDLNSESIERYSRNILLPEIGGKGQSKLLKSSVLVIGAGGLGSPLLMYLASSGIGKSIAILLAQCGATVAVNHLSADQRGTEVVVHR